MLRQLEIARLADRMSYSIDPEMGHAGVVEVKARSGQVYRLRVDKPLGDPSKPLSTEQLREKFLDCARYAPAHLSDATLEEIVERIDRLEDEPDVSALARLASGG